MLDDRRYGQPPPIDRWGCVAFHNSSRYPQGARRHGGHGQRRNRFSLRAPRDDGTYTPPGGIVPAAISDEALSTSKLATSCFRSGLSAVPVLDVPCIGFFWMACGDTAGEVVLISGPGWGLRCLSPGSAAHNLDKGYPLARGRSAKRGWPGLQSDRHGEVSPGGKASGSKAPPCR